MSASHPVELETLFGDYPLDHAFDEMRQGDGEVRPHYRALAETLAGLPPDELQLRKQSADLAFLTQGITFTVYGRDEGKRAHFSLRPAAAPGHRAGVGPHRARA